MSATIAGTLVSGRSANVGIATAPMVVPTNTISAKLTLGGAIDASNTCKTQKSTNNGLTWADQSTYNSAQAAVGVTVAAGEHWRIVSVAAQAIKQIDYKLTCES